MLGLYGLSGHSVLLMNQVFDNYVNGQTRVAD
jgi:hypothetical protein